MGLPAGSGRGRVYVGVVREEDQGEQGVPFPSVPTPETEPGTVPH